MASGVQTLHKTLSARLGASGFDLVHAFRASWYNRALVSENLELKPIPTFGRDDCPAFLIGHTKAFWPAFVSGLKSTPSLLQETDPIDCYTKQAISAEMQSQGRRADGFEMFLSNEYGERLVSMQRVADISALAQLDYNTYLSIHPSFGPWIAFRAVLVINEPADEYLPLDPPSPIRGLLSNEDLEKAKQALQAALDRTNVKEMAKELEVEKKTETVATWRLWMAMREVMSIGSEHHYPEDQAEYHYTKNKEVLARAAAA